MKAPMIMFLLVIFFFGCNRNLTGPGPQNSGYTATEKLADVNMLADSFNKGLVLMSVSSKDVNYDGEAAVWYYEYVYPDTGIPPKVYWFHADANGAGFDSISLMGTGVGVIAHSWFNSDSALTIAEQNGSSNFRSRNPNYTIEASVGEPVVPNHTTHWYVDYRSKNSNGIFFMARIDANTGAVMISQTK